MIFPYKPMCCIWFISYILTTDINLVFMTCLMRMTCPFPRVIHHKISVFFYGNNVVITNRKNSHYFTFSILQLHLFSKTK
jgi:hypothetical protein